ncbi:MAG: HAD family phosphatase [bacterium]|nr:HAD family phosphatase [bacterium]
MLFKAVIFDLDGVISDTQVIHSAVESLLFARYGISIAPEEISRRFAGTMSREYFPVVFREAGKTCDDLEGLIRKRRETVMECARGNVRPIPGAPELIAHLASRKIPLAVGSGSNRSFIDLVLSELQLEHYFSAIASSDDVAKSKPDPAIFLLAAERLQVSPSQCVVIEDGINGMVAARAAGMKCIALVPPNHPPVPADIRVQALSEISVSMLE